MCWIKFQKNIERINKNRVPEQHQKLMEAGDVQNKHAGHQAWEENMHGCVREIKIAKNKDDLGMLRWGAIYQTMVHMFHNILNREN